MSFYFDDLILAPTKAVGVFLYVNNIMIEPRKDVKKQKKAFFNRNAE